MSATPETLTHYAYQCLGLAAEMEVDGYDPTMIHLLETAGGSLLVAAAKAERHGRYRDLTMPGVDTSAWTGSVDTLPGDTGPFMREPQHPTLGQQVEEINQRAGDALLRGIVHDIGPFMREPQPHDVARKIPGPYAVNSTGQLTCCGHEAASIVVVNGVRHREHFPWCPNYRAEAAQ